jgi:hypothetical protein
VEIKEGDRDSRAGILKDKGPRIKDEETSAFHICGSNASVCAKINWN